MIPVSIIGTFVFLNVMGRSLNVISLAGLAFAVGMFIDNAIVVLENIYPPPFAGRIADDGDRARHAGSVGRRARRHAHERRRVPPVIFMQEEAGPVVPRHRAGGHRAHCCCRSSWR